VSEYFSVIVGGDDVVHGKPAPDLFLSAARQLGVAPSECVVLEDSDAGIHAASAAGMVSVMVPDLKPPTDESGRLALRVASSLHDAQGVLAEMLGFRI